MPGTINILSDNVLELSGLKNEITEAFINDATVTATLVDRDGAEVSGQSWPLTLDYVAASDGIYRGTLSDSLVLIKFETYVAQVNADAGPGLKQYWECDLIAQAASC